jgi:Tfp pilus assembly protein PilF
MWCTNLRAMALVKLGRNDDATRRSDDALQEDPENALTHANQGWALLYARDHRRALEHFASRCGWSRRTSGPRPGSSRR